jgi:hypothetical protein
LEIDKESLFFGKEEAFFIDAAVLVPVVISMAVVAIVPNSTKDAMAAAISMLPEA